MRSPLLLFCLGTLAMLSGCIDEPSRPAEPTATIKASLPQRLIVGATSTTIGNATDIGDLGYGFFYYPVLGSSGDVVGTMMTSPSTWHGVRFLHGSGVLEDFGTPWGCQYNVAAGVNSLGVAVGYASGCSTATTGAFIATPGDTLRQLSPLSGMRSLRALAINDAGMIAGLDAQSQPLRWDVAGTMSAGLFAPSTNGLTNPLAGDPLYINASGTITGQLTDRELRNGLNLTVGFVWELGGSVRELGSLGGYGTDVAAINSSGVIVGRSSTAAFAQHAFRWTSANGMEDLGTLGGNASWARAVNDVGTVVGISQTATSVQRAFIWSQGSGMSEIPLPRGYSDAKGINNSGVVTGTYAVPNGDGTSALHAFRWSTSLGYEDLGTLGGRSSEGFAINAAGEVAGYWESETGGGNRGHYALWEATVTNHAPAAVVNGPYTGTEGSPVSVSSAGSSDTDGDALSYYWDFGDGTAAVSTSAVTASHTYADNGTYTVSLTVDDGNGDTDIKSTTATIANSAPTVGAVTTSAGTALVRAGTSVSASAPFTDPGSLDSQTGTIIWDVDNTAYRSTAATITKASGTTSGTVSASRSLGAGVYTVRFDVTDKDFDVGNSTAANYIVVYDATGGSVAGNGAILSPAGACTLVSCGGGTSTGPATFAFSAKYKKGTNTTPSGSTVFKFIAGSLSFSSSTTSWLVVSGPLAQFKGTGKINKKGSYGFLITAIDGQISGGDGVDKFRIKIWDTATGSVVYDNQRGQAEDSKAAISLSSGSIAITP